MPHGDRMGPYGEGPMTGRGLGYCAGFESPGAFERGGRGMGGRGMGAHGGHGHRNWYRATGLTGWQRAAGWGAGWAQGPAAAGGPWAVAPPTREQQIIALRAQADAAEKAAQSLRLTLADLERDEGTD